MVARLYEYRSNHREGLILQYNDGWGEIAPLPGFSSETFIEARKEILHLLPTLSSAQSNLPSVQFGLSCAQKTFSLQPLKVPLCAFQSPEHGCRTLKLKIGHLDIDQAVSLVNKYKGDYLLRVDCNQKWGLEKALQFASYFVPADFDYIEEPVDTFSDLVTFSKETQFPIAVDEFASHASLLKIPSLKAVVMKPMIKNFSPSTSIPTVLSSAYESSLGHLLIARLASSDTIPLGLGTFRLCSDGILNPPLRVLNGFLCWEPLDDPINLDKLCLIASVP